MPESSKDSIWIFEILIGVGIIVLANFILKRTIIYFKKRLLSEHSHWKERIEGIFYRPMHVLLWLFGIIYVLSVLTRRFGFFDIMEYLGPLRKVAIVICFAWALLRWKGALHHILTTRGHPKHKIDLGTVNVLSKLLTIAIALIASIIALSILGLNVMPLIAFGGIGAAALGFAGKDVIANFFGGMMLSISRPFTVGDLILLPDRNLEGYVEDVGWYITSIRDKEKRPVYLPNSIFSTMHVINSSRMSHRRIEEKISIRYEDFSKVKEITASLKKAIQEHPGIDTNLPILVFFHSFNDSLDIYIDVYSLVTNQEEFLALKEEIMLKLYDLITAQHAEIHTPKMLVEMRKMT